MVEIIIDEKFIQGIGSNSLLGCLFTKGIDEPQAIKLIFPQTTLNFRRNNNGPKEFIIYEYNIPCLINDVIYLQNIGYEILTEIPMTEIE